MRRAVLLKRFLDSAGAEPDPNEHTALVLTNITRLSEGRKLLLQPGRGTLRALVSQLSSPSHLRRSGCASAVRNCCFRAEVRSLIRFQIPSWQSISTNE